MYFELDNFVVIESRDQLLLLVLREEVHVYMAQSAGLTWF